VHPSEQLVRSVLVVLLAIRGLVHSWDVTFVVREVQRGLQSAGVRDLMESVALGRLVQVERLAEIVH
jgi:hypothetical protein